MKAAATSLAASVATGPALQPDRWAVAAPGKTTKCETCGNTYDKAFQVVMHGQVHVFDCFECAIQSLAPKCEHCGCRIIGHGVEENGHVFCCAHCAHHEGADQVTDRA